MSLDDRAEDIRRRMAELRSDLAGDVREVSQSARAMTDWTKYVRRFPWAIAAVAAAAGFLLIPRKKQIVTPDPDTIAEMVRKRQIRVETAGHAKESKSLLKSLLVMGVTWAAKAGMNYMGQRIQNAAAHPRPEPPHATPAPAPLEQPWPK